MSYITSIGIANPENKIEQSTIADFMVKAMALNADDERKIRALHRMSGIGTRHSVLTDYGRNHSFEFYPNDDEPFPTTKQRLVLFRKHAVHLSVSASEKCLSKILDQKSGVRTSGH